MIAAVPALIAGASLAASLAPLDGGDRFSYDPLSRVLEAKVVAADAGSRTLDAVLRNAAGQSLEGHRIVYEYDALGRLLARTHWGARPEGVRDDAQRPFVAQRLFTWDGEVLLAEVGRNFAGELIWRQLYLPGAQGVDTSPQVRVEKDLQGSPSAKTYAILRDEMGTVIGIAEEREGWLRLVARVLYTPYGEAHLERGPELVAIRFDEAVTQAGGQKQTPVPGESVGGALAIHTTIALDPKTFGAGLSIEEWDPVSMAWRAPPAGAFVVAAASDAPEVLHILPLAGWPKAGSFRITVRPQLADGFGRPLQLPPEDARGLETVLAIPEDGASPPPYARTFPVRFDTIEAASDTLCEWQGSTCEPRLPGGQTSLFQGAWTDPVTGLAYHRARWYDPRNATWLSEDPLEDADSPNLYAFVSWQPHMYTDPMGRCRWNDWECWGWVGEEFAKNIVTDPNAWSTGLGFTPVVGDIKDWQEAITGVDLVTGERLASWQRGVTVVAGVVPVLPGKGLRELTDAKGLLETPALPPGRVAKALPPGRVAFDPRVGRYRDLRTGRFVAQESVVGQTVRNAIPRRAARVIVLGDRLSPENVTHLGPPGATDVFITAAADIRRIKTARGLAKRLTLVDEQGQLLRGPMMVIEFDTPPGIASPVFRSTPGFVGFGRTARGAREFVIPNLPLEQLQPYRPTTRILR